MVIVRVVKSVISFGKATSRFASKLTLRSFRKTIYQSRLYEGDRLKKEAISCIETCKNKLNQDEIKEWDTMFESLNVERKKLIFFARYEEDLSAELSALAGADKSRVDARRLRETASKFARIGEGRPDVGASHSPPSIKMQERTDDHVRSNSWCRLQQPRRWTAALGWYDGSDEREYVISNHTGERIGLAVLSSCRK
ncbi:hypothetical protein AcW1_008788 [Taiwanofungus camphoratus]|nr:hypothetical protein AcV5_006819 [Antrodia cinnamomea]KAI0935232.1 hypothetical protein AcV7_003728 [Antrodia cinnamomea]KAI0949088.1 hypothetical protein AcW1_008788 [Antrodia cinnamomea]